MIFSKRMDLFSESIFTVLAKKVTQRKEAGLNVIDFSTGTPNIPPTKKIREILSNAALDPKNYVYAINDLPALIDAVISWYKKRYDVHLEQSEVCSLLGSQEGLSHLAMTLINDGDIVLVPNPSYPIFKDGPLLAGAKIVEMPLLKENNYLIDFKAIDKEIAKKAKFMIVSYPNNPTCAIANDEFYMQLIDFAKNNDIIVLHDNAYSELLFEAPGKSFLSYPGAKEVGIEFNSLSKTYGLAGARIGFAIGNQEIIKQIKTLKSNMDYGMFIPIQLAANAVQNMYEEGIDGISFAVCNTDSQPLARSAVPVKLLLGKRGLGVGGVPEKGREEAESSLEQIKSLFADETEMVFVTAGMGGGTGTGAAPVVAGVARSMGLLTIGVVTIPFFFEKEKKIIKALKGVEEMRKNVDALLIVNNESLCDVYADSKIPVKEAFKYADNVLCNAVKSIAELITVEGNINLDFCDVESTMKNGGEAIMAIAGHCPASLLPSA